jgi:hypothetical protein
MAAALPEARSRAEPKENTQVRRQLEQTFFDPDTSSARRAQILKQLDVGYVLLDTKGQANVAPKILAQPGLTVAYRGPRFVILRVDR